MDDGRIGLRAGFPTCKSAAPCEYVALVGSTTFPNRTQKVRNQKSLPWSSRQAPFALNWYAIFAELNNVAGATSIGTLSYGRRPLSEKLNKALRVRQRVGKYRIEKRLGEGGFARVYQAMDTIQGIRVALKIPHAPFVTDEVLEDFRKEARTTSKLEHQNILPIKDASIIDERFVIVFPLGERTLDDRMKRRMSVEMSLNIIEQILEAVAYAHRRRIIHCDIKPENVILFPDGRVRLTDFGIAKVAQKTIRGSGTGTVGFMAPEQAMGKPSMKSDVFSSGLLMYRMLAGKWPEWPFEWPGPAYRRLKSQAHPDLMALIRKATELAPRKRFRDGNQLLNAFQRVKPRSMQFVRKKKRRAA